MTTKRRLTLVVFLVGLGLFSAGLTYAFIDEMRSGFHWRAFLIGVGIGVLLSFLSAAWLGYMRVKNRRLAAARAFARAFSPAEPQR